MSNEMIRLSRQIKFLAKELAEDKPIKKQDILLDPETERKVNIELQAYRKFLKSFLNQHEDNAQLLGRLKELFEKPESKKPTIRPLLNIKKLEKKELESLGDFTTISHKLTHIMRTYGTAQRTKKYPSVNLLKEILNFGVVKGNQAFRKLLLNPTLLFSDFKTHGILEHREEKGTPKS